MTSDVEEQRLLPAGRRALLAGALLVLAFTALAAHGATRAVWLAGLAATPLCVAFVAESLPAAVAAAGAAALGGGVVALVRARAPAAELVAWSALAAALAAIGAFGAALRRRALRDAVAAADLTVAECRRAGAVRDGELRVLVEAIAHEVNNPLAAVKANVQCVREQLQAGRLDPADAEGALEDAAVGIARIAGVVRELRAHVRALDPEPGSGRPGGGAALEGIRRGLGIAAVAGPEEQQWSPQRFLDAVLACDRRAALDIARQVFERDGLAALYEGTARPALEALGDRWERDELGVEDEHLATALVDLTLASLHPAIPWPRGGPVAVVACAPGERHEVGARMVADLLALDGWTTRFLGADTPPEGIARMAARTGAALVAVSVTMTDLLSGARGAIAAARCAAPAAGVLAGGRAVAALRGGAAWLGADAVAGCGRTAVDLARPWKRRAARR
jgi:methanogenic corrinoid protein MtbC1